MREFADQICLRARDVDPDLIGTGLQRIDSDGMVLQKFEVSMFIKSFD